MKKRILLISLALLAVVSTVLADDVIITFYADGVELGDTIVSSGSTYTISTLLEKKHIDEPTGCREYDFVGWRLGGPVEPGEAPTLVTSVTPEANVNIYAVYNNPDVITDNYIRITSTDDLESGAKYLIVCYYDDGEDQYYALGNRQESYEYNTGDKERWNGQDRNMYERFYYISSENYRYYPEGGVIANPQAANIWTLTGSANNWKWTNNSPYQNNKNILHIQNTLERGYYSRGQWNRTSSSARGEILDNKNNTCAITASDGTFHFKSGNYYLTYVPDEVTKTDDWFVTRTAETEDYVIYLYKQASTYTSYPSCKPWKVYVDAMDGTITGKTAKKDTVFEAPKGGDGVTLPDAEIACNTWDFLGWHSESPVQPTYTSPSYAPATTPKYHPTFDGETMYAVYRQKFETYYERITSISEIVKDGVYVLVLVSNSRPVNTTYSNYTFGRGNAISVDGEWRITSVVDETIEWKFDGTRFVGSNGKYLTYDGNGSGGYSNYYYYVSYVNNAMFSLAENGYNGYLGQTNNNVFGEVNSAQNFYIYKKHSPLYSSYPHCAPYTVNLHGCGGLIDSIEGQFYLPLTEGEDIDGVQLPIVAPLCQDSGWVFAGWHVGSDITSTESTEYEADLKPGGEGSEKYHPKQNNEDLYAVFRRPINKYRIVAYPNNMVLGDKYILTYYAAADPDDGNIYDWELSAETNDDTSLKGVQGAAPQDEGGYYMIENDSLLLWELGGTSGAWTFKNVKNDNQYLTIGTSGELTTSTTETGFVVERPNTSVTNLQIYYVYGGYYNLLKYDGSKFIVDKQTSLTFTYQGETYYYDQACFLYRQMKEYSSWPHCDPFTILFEGCGGNAAEAKLTEPIPYAGVTLPTAYVNSDCAREKWEFIGWATTPVTSETSELPVDLLPEGVHYRLSRDSATLYAVYQIPDSTYTRITSMSDLRLGINYIVTSGTTGNSRNRAMSNTPYETNYLASISVNPVTDVITTTNKDIAWRLQGGVGAYVFFNVKDSVYLDLRSKGYAKLSTKQEDDFLMDYGGNRFLVRSNKSLAGGTEAKYLGYNASSPFYFKTVAVNSNYYTDYPELLFYRQNATYNSYPLCVDDVEALRWDYDAENDSSFVYVESYVLSDFPKMDGAIGTAKLQDDGTFKIKYNKAAAPVNSKKPVTWSGTTSRLRIPYVIYKDTNVNTLLTGDCSKCDIVVLDGVTLTINADRSIHNLTLYEGSTLNVVDGNTLTVNSLILRCEDDQKLPTVNLNSTGNISLNNDEIFFDARIDEERYYWYSLPFNAQLQKISYSNIAANGGAPTYRTDFWVKYYDGERRVNDINNSSYTGNATGSKYWSHVAASGADYTLKAGQGYIVGIADQKDDIQADGRKHTKRVMRFTLKTESGWLDAERVGGTKTTTVVPSVTNDPRNIAHAGWNLIGNPYMHAYTAGSSSSGVGGLRVGAWEKDDDGWYVLDEDSLLTVPYLTKYIYDETESKWKYVQRLASNTTLHPFEAVFVQINSGTSINFASLTHHNPSNAPAYLRNAAYEEDTPFRTGVVLSGAGKTDATGIVLSNEYTPAYEIGADLMKMLNSKALNLYTLNADNQELAFNGLSEENAISPIPVGVIFPSAGTYTFAFDAKQYSMDGLESLVLIDKVAGTQTELLYSDYDFTIDGAATINNRFELLVRRAHKVPTDISFTSEEDQEVSARKFIREGKLFIIRDNKIYDATGARVQ